MHRLHWKRRTYVPSVISEGLPAPLYAHTEAAIDFGALRGKRVAVIGGAASAFDAAGMALEAGAASVHLLARRAAIASVPITRSRGYAGAYDNYYGLPDAIRWEQALRSVDGDQHRRQMRSSAPWRSRTFFSISPRPSSPFEWKTAAQWY